MKKHEIFYILSYSSLLLCFVTIVRDDAEFWAPILFFVLTIFFYHCGLLYQPLPPFYRSENNTKIAEAILEQLRNNVNDFTARKSPNNMSDSIVNTKGTVEINIEDLRAISPASIYFSPEEKTEIREIIKTILDNDTNKIIESL